MRDQIFKNGDRSIFTFGGGLSIDKAYRTKTDLLQFVTLR